MDWLEPGLELELERDWDCKLAVIIKGPNSRGIGALTIDWSHQESLSIIVSAFWVDARGCVVPPYRAHVHGYHSFSCE